MKQCRGPCRKQHPLTNFRRNTKSKDGRESVCKQCRGEQDRAQKMARKYGITVEKYNAMLEAQEGLCAICRQPPRGGKRLQIDHCHDTGKVRGLLCGSCNTALGLLRDNVEAITRAAHYVARHQEEEPMSWKRTLRNYQTSAMRYHSKDLYNDPSSVDGQLRLAGELVHAAVIIATQYGYGLEEVILMDAERRGYLL